MTKFKRILPQSLIAMVSLFAISFLIYGFTKDKDEPEVDPMIYYYMGESKATAPDSTSYGTYVILTKQTVNKKERLITMEAVSIDQKGEILNVNYKINVIDPEYIIKDDKGEYTGKGKYHGKEWKWTSWNYTINYTNPVGHMKGRDYISLVGLIVTKDFYGPDQKKLIHYREKHKFITKDTYEILLLQVLKASSK